jgi:hypothetical protein
MDHSATDAGTLSVGLYRNRSQAKCWKRRGHPGKQRVTDNLVTVDRNQRQHNVPVVPQPVDKSGLIGPAERRRYDRADCRQIASLLISNDHSRLHRR